MKVAFVLARLSPELALQLEESGFDQIFHFSTDKVSQSKLSVPCFHLQNAQLNAIGEAVIVERCINRNISKLTKSVEYANLLRRALRLSELRVEARSYFNAMEILDKKVEDNFYSEDLVTFYSHYLVPDDVGSFNFHNVKWEPVLNKRFLGLFRKLSRILSTILRMKDAFRYLIRHKVDR